MKKLFFMLTCVISLSMVFASDVQYGDAKYLQLNSVKVDRNNNDLVQIKGEDVQVETESPYVNPDYIATSRAAITVRVTAGGYGSEQSWDITDSGGAIVASGGAQANCETITVSLDLPDGDYTFTGYDQYGDDWNSSYCPDCSGMYYTYGSFGITDADGNVLAGQADCETSSGPVITGASSSFAFTVGAVIVLGCTDEAAENYDAAATLNDGSCTYNGGCAYSNYIPCGDFADSGQCFNESYLCDGTYLNGTGSWSPDCSDGSDEDVQTCCELEDATYAGCTDAGCTDSEALNYNPLAYGESTGCEYAAACEGTEVTFNLYDSWGDGWGGGSIDVGDQSLTLLSGSSDSFEVCVAASGEVSYTYNAPSSYASENSFSVTLTEVDADGYDVTVTLSSGYGSSGSATYSFCLGGSYDECGVCLGDDSSCADCAGTPNGDATEDCNSECNGTAYTDECGDCVGGSTGLDACPLDCAGVPNGLSVEDGCGDCWAPYCYSMETHIPDYTSNQADCEDAGLMWIGPGGSGGMDPTWNAAEDECGVCDGDNSSCTDECGVINGDNSSCADCAGVPNGANMEDCDDSGDCGGVYSSGSLWLGDGYCDGASQPYGLDLSCYDCDGGDCVDACGVCEGDGSSCWDCCQVSNGDNSSCGGTGDINEDDEVDILDIIGMIDDILETASLSTCALNEADANGDGSLNVLDVLSHVEFILANIVYGCMDPNAGNYNPDANTEDNSCQTFCQLAGGDDGYLGDGYCDSSNNNEGCGYDGGDCCPGDCVDGIYTCSSYGGDCGDCADPNSADLAEGGTCNQTPGSQCSLSYTDEAVIGCDGYTCVDPANLGNCTCNSSLNCEENSYDGGDCGDTLSDACAAVADCLDAGGNYGWTGDGYCDSSNNNAACNYDEGDCCPSTCTDGTYSCDTYGGDCEDCEDPNSADLAEDGDCYTPACEGTEVSIRMYDTWGDGWGDGSITFQGETLTLSGSQVDHDFCLADGSYTLDYNAPTSYASEAYFGVIDWSLGVFVAMSTPLGDTSTTGGGYFGHPGGEFGFTIGGVQAAVVVNDGIKSKTESQNLYKVLDAEKISSDQIELFKAIEIEKKSKVQDTQDLSKSSKVVPSVFKKASEVQLIQTESGLSYEADGVVAFEMTLLHGDNFEITTTTDGFIASSNTIGNTTKVVVVNHESNELFTTNSSFEITDMMAVTSGREIDYDITVKPSKFGLSKAYPNPFNPSTNLTLDIAQAGNVTVQVYNIVGQLVSTLVDGHMDIGSHSLTFDASDLSSGMYLLRAQTSSNVQTQKVMLLK